MELNKVTNMDCFAFMKSLPPDSVNIIYTDTPYNMGAKYYIDKEGHYCFVGKGSDFMNKWEAMDGRWWDKFFYEAYRIIKPGGFFITHNIDRQSDLWTYYARRNKFFPTQKLYWLFINSFPKGTDVGLQVDNLLGVKRDVVGIKRGAQSVSTGKYGAWGKQEDSVREEILSKSKDQAVYWKGKMSVYEETVATSEIAKKYEGYKYGQAALKQVMEEVLVFNKEITDLTPGRVVITYENKRKTGVIPNLHPPVLNIAGTSVRPSKSIKKVVKDLWTPQLLVDTNVSEDMLKHLSHQDAHDLLNPMIKIDFAYEDYPPYIFCRKPSLDEKEAGLDSLQGTKVNDGREKDIDNPFQRGETVRKNIHPTVKPIELCKKILSMFIIPDSEDMIIYDPFTGSGTIPIACEQLGLKWIGTEITPEFIEIINLRLAYYRNKKEEEPTLFG